MSQLSTNIEEGKHDQSSDTSRDIAVNKEMNRLSDSLKQVELDVQNALSAQKNSAKNLKASEGRTADVVSAKLNKLESILNTNSMQIENLQHVMADEKQAIPHHMTQDMEMNKAKLDKDVEGHEQVIQENLKTVEGVATKVQKEIDSLSKHVSMLEANQKAGEEKLLGALSELTNGLVNSKHERSKSLQLLYQAQQQFNDKLQETRHKEHKPLMVVIPETQTDSPSQIIGLHDAKHILNSIDDETANLETKEEDLVGVAVKQDFQLRTLRNQTDETVNTLLKGAEIMKKEANEETRKDTEEQKDEKLIKELKEKASKGWSSWSGWSTCYGFGCKSIGRSQRFRVCQSDGGQCGGDYWQSKSCRRSCPFNGLHEAPMMSQDVMSWSEWEDWSECSISCGDGSSTRTRLCNYGKCVGHSTESKPCSNQLCASENLPDDSEPRENIRGSAMTHLADDNNQEHLGSGYPSAVITCEARPCMNGGVCIDGGEGREMSHLIHFHCKCVHPYKGIMCDTVCDVDTETNGIVIGILAGILGMALLGIVLVVAFNFRRKVKKWRKASDPHCRRPRGCWETLFGSRASSISSYSNSRTCSSASEYKRHPNKHPSCSSTCGTVSTNDYAYDPLSLTNHNTDVVGRSRVMKSLFEDKPPAKLSITQPDEGDKTSRRQSKGARKESTIEESTYVEAESEEEETEESSSEETDSNENDNAADHTTTQTSLAQNKTNNQSQSKKRIGRLSPIIEEHVQQKSTSPNGKFVKGQRNRHSGRPTMEKPTTDQLAGKELTRSKKNRGRDGTVTKSSAACVLPEAPGSVPSGNIEENLNRFLETCDQMDPVPPPAPKFRDPQLAERLKQIRNQSLMMRNMAYEDHMITSPDPMSTDDDMAVKYPLVGNYLSRWRESGRSITGCLPTVPASTSNSKPVVKSPREPLSVEPHKATDTIEGKGKTAEQLLEEVKGWRSVIGNPVHSIWKEVDNSLLKSVPTSAADTTSTAAMDLNTYSPITSAHINVDHMSTELNSTGKDLV